ncbi:hypothetical protein C8J56DRAFT_813282 [Mycena floridula]|nr:hypothetical protein C8J56DRAFT_813282 [Mycena floridula]
MASNDKVNLRRLVKILDKTVSDPEWSCADSGLQLWIKAANTLEQVKYARKLLEDVELYDVEPSHDSRYTDMRQKLNRVESIIQDVEKRTTPQPIRPKPLLQDLPIPQNPRSNPESQLKDSIPPAIVLPDGDLPSASLPLPSAEYLLLSPSDRSSFPSATSAKSFASPTPSLLTPTFTPTKSTTTALASASLNQRHAQNSNTVQQELQDQLALMAAQLKRNAQHFASNLEKDKAVVQEMDEKLDTNYDVMVKERIRLRDHKGKSRSTTCLVMMLVLVVLALFIFVVFIMRVT